MIGVITILYFLLQLGTQGEISLSGAIRYSFEAESDIQVSHCENGFRFIGVCTTVEDYQPHACVNLSTWFKAEKSLPCGFEVCFLLKEGNDMNFDNLYSTHIPDIFIAVVCFHK